MTIQTDAYLHHESPKNFEGSASVRPPRDHTPGGFRELVHLSYPVVLTHISMTLMGVIDSAMVGRLGASQLAAVGFGGVWIWTLFTLFMGTANSVQTFVSQHWGAKDDRACGFWAWQGLYALIPATAVGAAVFFLQLEALLDLMAPSAAVRDFAGRYMAICAAGAVGVTAATILSSFFMGIGDSRTPLYVTISAVVLNAFLDYALIFGHFGFPRWGVEGAAVATVASQWTQALVILWIFSRRSRRIRYGTRIARPNLDAMRRLLRVGAPIGGQWSIEMLSFAAFLTVVARLGDAPLAASQAFIALLSLSFMQAEGLGVGVSTLVGKYIGARDPAAADRSYRSAQKLTLLLSAIIAILLIGFPNGLLRIFSDDPEVLRLGAPLLAIGALYQFFDAFAIVSDGALRGAGDTRNPFVVRLCLAWGLFLPLAWVLGVQLDGGLTAAWLAGTLYVALLSAYLVMRFRSGAWRRLDI
jgi:MATE family multidrug resistance protein